MMRLLFSLLLTSALATSGGAANPTPPPLTLRVMSFNLRFASPQPPHA